MCVLSIRIERERERERENMILGPRIYVGKGGLTAFKAGPTPPSEPMGQEKMGQSNPARRINNPLSIYFFNFDRI